MLVDQQRLFPPIDAAVAARGQRAQHHYRASALLD